MARRERSGRPTALGTEVTSVLRRVFSRGRNVHPEIWARWPQIAGPQLAGRAVPRSLRGRTLVVAVGSSPWLQELSFLRPQLLDNLTDQVGPGVVEDIRLVLDPDLTKS
ncbi:MAG: DUF721 domain-containing protein [Polyangia bacterium]